MAHVPLPPIGRPRDQVADDRTFHDHREKHEALDAVLEFDVPICGERLLGITHHLLGRATGLDAVTRVASHPQPLAQCRHWLDAKLPGVPRVETASTAAAAGPAQMSQFAAREGRAAGPGADCRASSASSAADSRASSPSGAGPTPSAARATRRVHSSCWRSR